MLFRSVMITLTADPSYTVASPLTDTVTIADNEPEVTVVATDASAGETAAPTAVNGGTFTVSRTGSTVAALTVFYTVGGSAASGERAVGDDEGGMGCGQNGRQQSGDECS